MCLCVHTNKHAYINICTYTGEWKNLLSALGLVPALVSPLDMVDVFHQALDHAPPQSAVVHTTVASVTAAAALAAGGGVTGDAHRDSESDGLNAPTITSGGGVDGEEDRARLAPVAAVGDVTVVARAGTAGREQSERRMGLKEYRHAVRRLAQRLQVRP